MSLNLSSILSQLSSQQTNGANAADVIKNAVAGGSNASEDNAGVAILKNMLAGDTFTGKVAGLNDDTALILLNDGSKVNARLSGDTNILVGQNVTFLVEENSKESIKLKPVETLAQEAMLINKALEAANLPATDANIDIVSELLSKNMPVNAGTIGEMVKNTVSFPDSRLDTIADLMRLEIPVTAENIEQFDAYRGLEHTISGKLSNVASELENVMNNIMQSSVTPDSQASPQVAAQLNDLINTLYTKDFTAVDANMAGNVLPSTDTSEVLNEAELNNLREVLELVNNADGEVTDKAALEKLSTRDALNMLTEAMKDPEKSGKLSKLQPEITDKLVNQMIDETLKITPENVAKEDGISRFYKRVRGALEKAGKELNDDSFNQMNKSMDQIKSNIDFMNDLNKNMTYFQMPVHFKHSTGDGELYVFTNKKALTGKSTDNISALLHLDMDNLGPMDVYVKMAGKSVSTNFTLESEELLDFVYEHIDMLNNRLEQLGYNTKFEMTVADEKKDGFSFVEDFIEKDITPDMTSQFIFDIKA